MYTRIHPQLIDMLHACVCMMSNKTRGSTHIVSLAQPSLETEQVKASLSDVCTVQLPLCVLTQQGPNK